VAGRLSPGGAVELVVLVGLQASGKSTFCQHTMTGDHVVVSKDHFRNARNPQRRQMQLIEDALAQGHSVAVDNTNPSPQEWTPLVAAARAHGATTIAYWFPPDLAGSRLRNAVRDDRTRVPEVGLLATLRRLRPPTVDDGFDRCYEVSFDGRGGFLVRTMDQEG
jgi:predicted kinase